MPHDTILTDRRCMIALLDNGHDLDLCEQESAARSVNCSPRSLATACVIHLGLGL